MRKSQIAINSVSTRHYGLEESLADYAEAGFRNVEFRIGHVRDYMAKGHRLKDVKTMLDGYGIRCIGGFDCCVECFSPAKQRAKNHARVVENARFLAELGGTNMVVGTDGPATPAEDTVDRMAKVFARLGTRIKSTGVTLCIEFNWSPIVKSLRMASEIARRSRVKNVGVLFDPAHYYCTPTKFDQLTQQNIACIKHVHVDDMRDKPEELSNCNADRVLPGKGCLDLKALFRQIERHGYKGYFSIEMFNEELWKMPPKRAAKLMYKSMQELRKSL